MHIWFVYLCCFAFLPPVYKELQLSLNCHSCHSPCTGELPPVHGLNMPWCVLTLDTLLKQDLALSGFDIPAENQIFVRSYADVWSETTSVMHVLHTRAAIVDLKMFLPGSCTPPTNTTSSHFLGTHRSGFQCSHTAKHIVLEKPRDSRLSFKFNSLHPRWMGEEQ